MTELQLQNKIDQLETKLAEVIGKHVGLTQITDRTLDGITREITTLLIADLEIDWEHFRMDVGPECPSAIIPGNLYTSLVLLLGVQAPTAEQCASGVYEHDNLIFRWDPETKRSICEVRAPLNRITVTVQIPSPTPWTPGEWRAYIPAEHKRSDGKLPDQRVCVLHPDQERILAHCQTGIHSKAGRIPHEQLVANARLMAQAPKMAELLEELATVRHDIVIDLVERTKETLKAAGHPAFKNYAKPA